MNFLPRLAGSLPLAAGAFFLLLPIARADDKAVPSPADAALNVSIGTRTSHNLMAVWPPTGIAGRPLLIAAHGAGGEGPDEMAVWLKTAQERRFTVVCPTFLTSQGAPRLAEDAPYFRECLRWVQDHLQYDKDNVYMTGASRGAISAWYLGTQRPDLFRGLFLQSGCFAKLPFGLDLSRWRHKPIKLIWGSEDHPTIPPQNQEALEMLKQADCKNYSSEVIAGGRHEEHPDLVANWMEQIAASAPSP